MLVLDVNTFFGTLPSRRSDYGLPTLLGQLERHGIAAALTYSLRGLYDDHAVGNAETLAACRANTALLPVATINPLRGYGLEDDIAQIRAGGFRAVRLLYGSSIGGLSPDSLSFRRLLEQLEPLGLPIIAAASEGGYLAALARVTGEHGLSLVLLDTSYSTQAEVEEIARCYTHVYVETSRLATPDAIGLLAREIGAERIVFGSGMPHYTPQASLNMVFQSSLDAEQRAQILSGNAIKLFGLREAVVPSRGTAAFRGSQGPKIDVHGHLHSGSYRFPIAATGPETAIEQCRRYNIEVLIASSATGIFYDMQAGNRELKTIIDRHPQFRGYVVTNPNFLEESCAEMDAYYTFSNFVGAKIHCQYSEQPTAGAPMRALFAEIAKRGRPVKIHNDGPGWIQALHDLAVEHPNLPIIVAHGGPPGTGRLLADVPNVYFEFCGSGPTRGIVRDALDAVGPERLLFGTDQDLFDPGFMLGTYYDADLSPEQERMIMYTNARRLFRLDG